MEPIDYVRALLRRWPLIVIAALIGAAFAFLGTDPEPEPIETNFQATHTLLADATSTNQSVGTITFAQVPVSPPPARSRAASPSSSSTTGIRPPSPPA